MKRRPEIFAPVLALLLAGGCESARADGSAATARPKVVVEVPQKIDYTQDLTLPGTLEGFEHTVLYGQVTGYIESITVDIGDRVEAGDVLARVLVPEMRADIQRAQASLLSARADLTRRTEEQQLAVLEKDRRQGLRQKERGAIAQTEVDVATATQGIAEAEVARAKADTRAAKAGIARLKALKDLSVLRAPFSGTIAERFLHPGALVSEGTSSNAVPVVELVRTNPLRLVFYVPEPLVPHVGVGKEVGISLDAFPGENATGKIARISGALDPETRSMRAEVDVLNEDGRLKPGMFVNVHMTAKALAGAMSLPSKAIRGEGEERYVLVHEGGTVQKRAVVIVFDDGKQAILGDGVGERDQVIVAGSPLAVEGVMVDATEAGAK